MNARLTEVSPNVAGRSMAGMWLHGVIAAVLCVLVGVTYFRVTSAGFVPLDDDVELLGNSHIRDFSAENAGWMFTDTTLTQRYAPLSWVAWALVVKVAGITASAFHWQSLIFHALNAVLLYFLLLAILERIPGLKKDGAISLLPLCAAAGAAIWAAHPLRVEVVAWATQVRYAEAQACAVAAILLYLTAVRHAGGQLWTRATFWGSNAFFAASVLFYPSAIGLPIVLLLMDAYLLGRVDAVDKLQSVRRLTLEKAGYFAIALAAGLMTVYGRAHASAFWGPSATLAQFTIPQRMMQAGFVLAYYVWKPFDLTHISPYYNYLVNVDPTAPIFLGSFLAVILLTAAAIIVRKKLPWFSLLWGAHLMIILPVGGYFEHPYMPGDRYAYLHDVLFAIALACGFMWLWPRASRLVKGIVPVATLAIILALACLSHAQTATWKSGETVFLNALAEIGPHPYQSELEWRLAAWYLSQRRPAEALDYANLAIEHGTTAPAAFDIKQRAQLALILTAQSQPASAPAAPR